MSSTESKNRPPIVYLARMRGGINLLCECLRILNWKQGGMRDVTSCQFYFVGPQVGCKLDKDETYRSLRQDQVCNRIPGMHWITLKGPTTRAIQLLQSLSTNPSIREFYPLSFVLPEDERLLFEHALTVSDSQVFILKPSKGSQGKGIVLALRDQLQSKCYEMKNQLFHDGNSAPFIVQHYISQPHTLRGYKYDLRLYVVMTSVYPLQCWVYKDGLVRFCTELYSKPSNNNVDLSYMHLSNYSLNCDSPKYDSQKSKQKLSNVLNQLCGSGSGDNSDKSNKSHKDEKKSDSLFKTKYHFWEQVLSICKMTMYSYQPYLRAEYESIFMGSTAAFRNNKSRSFHILGVDIMIDQLGSMTLLEVNCNPSLNVMKAGSSIEKSTVDVDVKTGLICGTLRLTEQLRCGKLGKEIAIDENLILTEECKTCKKNEKEENIEDENVDAVIDKGEKMTKTENQIRKEERDKMCNMWSTGSLPFYAVLCGDENQNTSKNETKNGENDPISNGDGFRELEICSSIFLYHRSHIKRGSVMTIDRSIIENSLRCHSKDIEHNSLSSSLSMLRNKYGQSLTMNKFFQAILNLSLILKMSFTRVLHFFPSK